MKLIVVNSNSSGNAYALDSGKEILLLEAGVRMSDVKFAINYRFQDVVGCVASHVHGDHSKYIEEYAKLGTSIYCNKDIADYKQFPYGSYKIIETENTYHIGSFSVTPFDVAHDAPCFGFLIKHPSMGVMMFVTDTYKIPLYVSGVNHYLIEANYFDELLKQNVWNGKINQKQADRIMLSHMSLEYTIKYLQECMAENAKTITLCHLSERNSDPDMFRRTVETSLGVPCYIAKKGLVVELNKEII